MMKTLLAIGLTAFSWGIYAPVLHKGQNAMELSTLRPFICVGLAYFLIAVLAPAAYLYLQGEKGSWTVSGALWSLIAGAAGAVGALGIIFALKFDGMPVYVMPLVFGGAPVINSFLTIYMSKTFKQVGPVFIAGLILVIAGAATVLIFKPGAADSNLASLGVTKLTLVLLSVGLTVLSWGAYGPVLHKGQMKMQGSRLRPLICVGLSYFAIAVVVPMLVLSTTVEKGGWSTTGTLWSLAAGAAGAVGALGIIMAFATGGKPIYVMPLVFGLAPVVNTFVSMTNTQPPHPFFYAGLIVVVTGAAVVLIFAPKGHAPAPAKT